MRAMILAAGLGTRMASLSGLCAKPALPVRGLPVISHLLFWLDSQGIEEVMINLHHQADTVIEAAERYRPVNMSLSWSHEPIPLGTGGGIRQAAKFLQHSDPSLVLTGDMLLDLDLASLVATHRERRDDTTLILRDDPRHAEFGTVGLNAEGAIRRIGSRRNLGGEQISGIFTGVRLFSARALDSLPKIEAFEDLSDWLMPRLSQGAHDIRGVRLDSEECVWEPVGTPQEYLRANLEPPILSFMDAATRSARTGTRVHGDVILGQGAKIANGAQLQRCVVWEGESVPSTIRGCDGVFACGTFHPCNPIAAQQAEPEQGADE